MKASPKRARTSDSRQESVKSKNSDEEDGGRQEGESSPARCPICLAAPENRAKSGACSHYFCYSCLKEWSKVKAECPLCKVPIQIIYYNIKSDHEFDEYHIKQPSNIFSGMGTSNHRLDIESFDNWWHFRMREYRNHLRRRRENEMAAMQACSDVNMIRKRRMYYWHKIRVSSVNTGRRVRDISPEFFQENPSQLHRLEPWLKRELTVLYGAHNRVLIRRVRDIIMSAAPIYGITSEEFRQRVAPYLNEHTDHFVHEFTSFARSPYTIQQYDRHAVYHSLPEEPDRSRRNPPGFALGISRPHRRPTRNPLRSRWDDSPEPAGDNPIAQSSQSIMLSQTTWGDDPMFQAPMYPDPPRITLPTVSVMESHTREIGPLDTTPPTDSREFRNPTPPRNLPVAETSFVNAFMNRVTRRPFMHTRVMTAGTSSVDVVAPLIHQRLPAFAYRSADRSHHRMEVMRKHYSQYMGDRARTNRIQPIRPIPTMFGRRRSVLTNAPDVIVISSDSSDIENNTNTTDVNVSRTLHYRPSRHSQQKKIKIEKYSKSSSSDSSTSDSENSEIEFVQYIKPPHMRTPDAYINLDSSEDENQPGPSKRHRDVSKISDVRRKRKIGILMSSSSSSSSDFSSSDDEKKNQTRDASHTVPTAGRKMINIRDSAKSAPPENDSSMTQCTNDVTPRSESSPVTSEFTPENTVQDVSIPSSSNVEMASPIIDVTTEFTPSPTDVENSLNIITDTTPIASKLVPKKIFEKGKVSINFVKNLMNKQFYNESSDSEIDVGTEGHPKPYVSSGNFSSELLRGNSSEEKQANIERKTSSEISSRLSSRSKKNSISSVSFDSRSRSRDDDRTPSSRRYSHSSSVDAEKTSSESVRKSSKRQHREISPSSDRSKHKRRKKHRKHSHKSDRHRRKSPKNSEKEEDQHARDESRSSRRRRRSKKHKRKRRSRSSSVELVTFITQDLEIELSGNDQIFHP